LAPSIFKIWTSGLDALEQLVVARLWKRGNYEARLAVLIRKHRSKYRDMPRSLWLPKNEFPKFAGPGTMLIRMTPDLTLTVYLGPDFRVGGKEFL